MLKDRYVRGEIELDGYEERVAVLLREPTGMAGPGVAGLAEPVRSGPGGRGHGERRL